MEGVLNTLERNKKEKYIIYRCIT